MRKGLVIALVIVAVLGLVGLGLFSSITGSYNDLVNKEEGVDKQWSQVENQLQRRSDLIPNLVATVKGYAKHENEIFTKISEARAKLAGAKNVNDKIEASGELSSALSRLLVIVENYPNLKADANFRQLQDELSGTENRIAVARMDYNESAQVFNSRIRSFPTTLWAGVAGFDKKPYFEAEKGAKEVPTVDFNK